MLLLFLLLVVDTVLNIYYVLVYMHTSFYFYYDVCLFFWIKWNSQFLFQTQLYYFCLVWMKIVAWHFRCLSFSFSSFFLYLDKKSVLARELIHFIVFEFEKNIYFISEQFLFSIFFPFLYMQFNSKKYLLEILFTFFV
jgi:hypothetical protein